MTEQGARAEARAKAEAEQRYPEGLYARNDFERKSLKAGFIEGWLASHKVVAAPSDTDRMLHARLTIAEAIIAEATHCVREEFPREQILAVLRNPLPPLRVSQPVQVEPEGREHCKSCGSRMWAGQLIRRNDSGRAVEHQNCDHPYHPAAEPVQVEVTAEIGTKIAELSEWIDGSYPESLIGTELHVRRRVDKLMEESGEVGQAVGGWFGENPRKGVTHTRADVLAELLDVAVTALGAYESLTGNAGSSIPALDAKLNMILERAGLSADLGGGDHAE